MKITSTSSLRRLILGILILILLAWHAGDLGKSIDEGKIPLNDFEEYWAASRIFMSGGNPYDAAEVLKVQHALGSRDPRPLMMWNPPWTLPLLLPFCSLAFWTGRGLWFLFNLSLILLIADWFWCEYGGPAASRWMSWLSAILFLPVGTSLFLGQISPLVLAGAAAFIWGLRRKNDFCAGAGTLGLAIKPHLLYLFWVFFVFWLVWERRWKVLFGSLAALAASSLIVLWIRPSVFHDYLAALTSSSGPGIWQTPTWGVALLMLFPSAEGWVRYLPSASGVVIAGVLWLAWRGKFDWRRHFPVISLLSVTTSSFTWMFDWVVLLPVVILIVHWFQSRPGRLWWLAAGLLLMQPLLVISPGITRTNFYTIWMPPALWLLYWAGSRATRKLEPGSTEGILPA